MIEEGSCEFCKFFKANLAPDKTPDGFCRRMPPGIIAGRNNLGQQMVNSQFPPVMKNFWCGEYRAKLDI
jgi:hypothetical protein